MVIIKYIKIILFHLLAITIALFFLLPIYWGFVSSFKPIANIFADISPLSIKMLLPFPFSLESYKEIFSNVIFMKALINTLFVSSITVLLGIFINSLAGYAFAVLDFKFKKLIFILIIITFLVPADLLVLPTYNLVSTLKIVDTKIALVMPVVANGLVIFMFTQFFKSIPRALIDIAIIDGAGHFKIFYKIFMPLCIPAIIGASLLLFLSQWEAFMWPLVVARSPENQMLQVALSTFKEEHGLKWNLMFAASSFLAVVPLAILIPLQKYYIQNITGSSVKG